MAPASNGGHAITTTHPRSNGVDGMGDPDDGVRTTPTYTVGGLTNGARYYFRVLAKTGRGSPAHRANRHRDPAGRADRGTFTDRRADQRVRPDPPLLAGPGVDRWRSDHRLRHPAFTERHVRLDVAQRRRPHYDVHRDRADNGTRFYFRVFARNAAGTSPSSPVPSAIPGPCPARRSSRALADFDGYVLLWSAPANNGSPITDYIVQVFNPDLGVWETYPDGVSTTGAILDISGFGCDDLRVAARNAAGNGPYSEITSCFEE